MAFSRTLLCLLATILVIGGFVAPARADAAADWKLYKERFVADDGRVVDTANGGISHSEGQGYGLILALANDDPGTFARIWTWTRSMLLIRDDGLLAWRYDPKAKSAITDINAATDGDVLVAYALLMASVRWSQPTYAEQARTHIEAIRKAAVREVAGYAVLLPGPQGFERPEGVVLNPSYWVFPAFQAFPALDDDPVWSTLVDDGRQLIERANETFGLPPDWMLLKKEGGVDLPKGFEKVSGYNALRVPLYGAWGRLDPQIFLRPFAKYWTEAEKEFPTVITLPSEVVADRSPDPAYQALRRLVLCALKQKPDFPFPPLSPQSDYYPASLLLLAEQVSLTVYPQCQ